MTSTAKLQEPCVQGEGAEGQCFRPKHSAWGSVGVSPSLKLDPCGQTLQSSEYGGGEGVVQWGSEAEWVLGSL